MGFLTGLGIKGWAIIALVVAIAGYVYVQKREIAKANDALVLAQSEAKNARNERDLAAAARDQAISANKQQEQAIKELEQEKKDIQTSLNALDADRRKSAARVAELSKTIQAMASDPANRVQISPVLRTTINEIQRQRAARQGVTQ